MGPGQSHEGVKRKLRAFLDATKKAAASADNNGAIQRVAISFQERGALCGEAKIMLQDSNSVARRRLS